MMLKPLTSVWIVRWKWKDYYKWHHETRMFQHKAKAEKYKPRRLRWTPAAEHVERDIRQYQEIY